MLRVKCKVIIAKRGTGRNKERSSVAFCVRPGCHKHVVNSDRWSVFSFVPWILVSSFPARDHDRWLAHAPWKRREKEEGTGPVPYCSLLRCLLVPCFCGVWNFQLFVSCRACGPECAKKHAHVVCSCGLVNLLECLSGEATRNLWRAVPRLRKLPAALRVRKRRF